MSLFDLVDNLLTDKNTIHSYLELYEKLLCTKKLTATAILEVGIGNFIEKNGGSIKMWYQYFPNATIFALDILDLDRVIDELKFNSRISLYTSTNAYDEEFFKTHFLDTGIKFDMLLDDGPHTLTSQQQFITLYSQVMSDDGILMVEDVQSWDWIEHLIAVTPEHLKQYIQVYDLRKNKNRYDDIVFVIDKYHVTLKSGISTAYNVFDEVFINSDKSSALISERVTPTLISEKVTPKPRVYLEENNNLGLGNILFQIASAIYYCEKHHSS